MSIQFEYFYGSEAEQFSFYGIPKLLMNSPKFKKLSDSAKLLYGLMLDRMGLSLKNGYMPIPYMHDNRAVTTYKNSVHSKFVRIKPVLKIFDCGVSS